MTDGALVRRRFIEALALGLLVLGSHLQAMNRRLDNWIESKKPARPDACPLCRSTMARDFRPSPHLEWYRCTGCGQSQVGVRVREAA